MEEWAAPQRGPFQISVPAAAYAITMPPIRTAGLNRTVMEPPATAAVSCDNNPTVNKAATMEEATEMSEPKSAMVEVARMPVATMSMAYERERILVVLQFGTGQCGGWCSERAQRQCREAEYRGSESGSMHCCVSLLGPASWRDLFP
jgi:hypothetical protein